MKMLSFSFLIFLTLAQSIFGIEKHSELLPLRTSDGFSSLSYRFNVTVEEKVYHKFKKRRGLGLMVMEVDIRNQRVFFLIYSEESQEFSSGWVKQGEFLGIAPKYLGRNEIQLEGITKNGVELIIRGAVKEQGPRK